MQLPAAFNAQEHDPSQGTGGLPLGKHAVIIESSEVKANKANDGGYIQLNLKITEGPQAGTVGAYRLNLYHSSQQVVEIAQRQFSAVCHAVGVFNVQDSSQLHNIPLMIEVGPQKNKPEYTEVKKVFDAAGTEPGKAPAQPAQPQAAAPAPAQGQPAAGGWGAPAQPAQPAAQQPQAQPAAPAQPAQGQPAWGQPAQPAQQPAQPASAPAPAQAAVPWGQPQG